MIINNDKEVATLQKDVTDMRRLKADFEDRCNRMEKDLARYEEENSLLKSNNKSLKAKI